MDCYLTSGGENCRFLSETEDYSYVSQGGIFKQMLFMKPAISEFGILNFKKFHLGGFSQLQLK